jgi:hypothetical protein
MGPRAGPFNGGLAPCGVCQQGAIAVCAAAADGSVGLRDRMDEITALSADVADSAA